MQTNFETSCTDSELIRAIKPSFFSFLNFKFRYRNHSIGDWIGLIKSIILEKLFWGAEKPNKKTMIDLRLAKEELKSGLVSPSFDNATDAIAWLRNKNNFTD